jgi:hypothetical protein
MKRGEKIIVFMDMLGFAKLTEQWPREIVHRRQGQYRMTGTSESRNQLSLFHSVLDQTIHYFTRMTATISGMSFSDCGFVEIGNPLLSATFAVAVMQYFVRAGVPVRMGMAAGTFWPNRMSSDVFGDSTISRAIFFGTAIVRAHQAEQCGLPGMRIFLHESIESVFPAFSYRFNVLRFAAKKRSVLGELSYLYDEGAYVDVNHPDPLDDDLQLWGMATRMRRAVDKKAPRRVHQQYIQTVAALQRMRKAKGRPPFRRRRT